MAKGVRKKRKYPDQNDSRQIKSCYHLSCLRLWSSAEGVSVLHSSPCWDVSTLALTGQGIPLLDMPSLGVVCMNMSEGALPRPSKPQLTRREHAGQMSGFRDRVTAELRVQGL